MTIKIKLFSKLIVNRGLFKYLLISYILCLEALYVHGQNTDLKEDNPSDAYQFALGLYNNAVKYQELVFTGSEYNAMTGKLTGHPYLIYDNFMEDTIVFDGMVFPNIPLQYDIVHDELIVSYVDQRSYKTAIQLRKDKVNSFIIDRAIFIYVGVGNWNTLAPGYYNLLYDGETVLLKKIKKKVRKEVDIEGVHISFKEIIDYIIIKQNQPYYITNKKSLFRTLHDKEKELSVFSKEEKLRFKDQKEEDMINLIQYYDQINK